MGKIIASYVRNKGVVIFVQMFKTARLKMRMVHCKEDIITVRAYTKETTKYTEPKKKLTRGLNGTISTFVFITPFLFYVFVIAQ